MGTERNGSRVSRIQCGEMARRSQQRVFAKQSVLLSLVMIVVVLWMSVAHAQTSSYVYDANGHVVAVTQSNGTTAQYTYDTLGHLAQTTTVASGQLAIFAFIPAHGEAGTQVTIEGHGFNASPASDSVAFNGTPATVVSASATQIVTTVPAGATTGSISVSTGGNTAVSATPFVVDNAGLPPTVTQISPTAVAAGSIVTITGTNLDPVSGETVIQLGATNVAVSSASNTQLQFVVPVTAIGGYVTVVTPYGQATGAVPVQVLPSAVAPGKVVSSGTATVNGAGVNLSINCCGQFGLLQFNGTAGNWLSLQVSGLSSAQGNVNYVVYGPNNAVIAQGIVAYNTPSIHLPQLTASGTYYATFQPATANVQLNATLLADTVLTSAPLTVTAAGAWQSDRLIFTAASNQNLELTLNGVTDVGGSQLAVNVYTASGTQAGSTTCSVSSPGSSCQIHLWSVAAGTYTVIVSPAGGTMGFNMLLAPDTLMPALTLNSTNALSFTAGQVQRFTFNATAGETVALKVAATTTPSASNAGIEFWVIRPDAGVITASSTPYTSFDSDNTATVNLSNLPVSGTYTIIAAPDYGLAASGQLQLVAGSTGNLTTNGASTTYSGSVAGQDVYMSFSATQGENLELTLSNLTVSGGNPTYVYVYNSAGTQITYFTCSTSNASGTCDEHLWDMAAGNYSVAVVPPSGNSVSFNALLQDDIVGPAVSINGGTTLNLGTGQVERFTFNGTAGQTLAVNLVGTTSPAGQGVKVLIYRPDVGTIMNSTAAYASFDTGTTPTVNLTNLPVSGNYTIIVAPDYGVALSAQLQLITGATGALSANGASQSLSTTFTGQLAYLSFTAQQNQNLELTFNNISASNPNGQALNVTVFSATGQEIANASCAVSTDNGSCILHLWSINAGVYSVNVQPQNSGTASFNVLLQQDISGPPLTPGTPSNIALGAGQVERMTFNATQGQTLALQLINVTTSPSLSGVGATFLVYTPNVGVITSSAGAYTSVHVVGSATVNLPNLPSTGAYTIIVVPDGGLPATAQLNIFAGDTGVLPANGGQQNFTTGSGGVGVYLSFTAQQGDNLELVMTNLSLSGSGSVGVTVFNQSGTQVAYFSDSPGNVSGAQSTSLWDLPAGTYSVVVVPTSGYGGGTMNFNMALLPDVNEGALTQGNEASLSLAPGQVARYTFNATADDTVTLQFPGVTLTPSGGYVQFRVYRPDAGVPTELTSAYYTNNVASTNTFTLSNLPMSGTYTLIVNASPIVSLGAGIEFSQTGSGPTYSTPTLPLNGTPVNETGSGSGQSITMSFNVTTQQEAQVTINNINVVGYSGQNGFYVTVYSPSGANVGSSYCYASNPDGYCSIGVYTATPGTYTVVASAAYGGTLNFTAQVQPWTTGPALAANTPTTVNLAAGQVEELTFNANAGDNVQLALSNLATTPAGQKVYLYVRVPDGSMTVSPWATTNTAASTTWVMSNVPVSGTYTVFVYTAYGEPASATLTLMPYSPTQLTENGAAQAVTTSVLGQSYYAAFTANQGDNVELTLAGVSATNGNAITGDVYVYGPNGNQVASTYCNSSNPGGDCRIPLWNLAPGTYSITVTPGSNLMMSFNMYLLSDTNGPNLSLNTPTSLTLGTGQVQRITFNGSQGSTYALSVSGGSNTPSGQSVYVTLYRPDAGTLTAGNYYTSISTAGATTLNLPTLPVSGTYTATVYTNYGEPGQLTLNLLPGVTGQLQTNAASQQFSTSAANQNAYLSFTANTGDNFELSFTGISGPFNFAVYNQNGTQVGGTPSCSAGNPGSGCIDPLWNLAAGTYSVVVTGGPTTFQAQLTSDVNGPTLTANTPSTVNLAAGQAERLTFNGVQGSPITLSLTGVSTTPSGQYVLACLYRPDTGEPTANIYCLNSNAYAYLDTTSNQSVNIASLPATGTYTVVVASYNEALPVTAQVLVTANTPGTLATDGNVNTFASTAANEDYFASFTANSGDNLELAFSNISGSNPSVTVTDQNGRAITTNNSCENFGCLYSLWNLAGGTYHVTVSPSSGGGMGFNAQLSSDVVEPALIPNATIAVNLPEGRVARYSFNGVAGQSATLNLSTIATNPSGDAMFIYVYRPDSGVIAQNPVNQSPSSTYNYFASLETSSSGSISIPNLPVSGNYTVIVEDLGAIPATAQLTYTIGATDTLVSGGSMQSVVVPPAQNASLTFSANSGDNLELSLNNFIAAGGNNGTLALTVYDPSGNVVTNFNCYASNSSPGCDVPLWNLVAGTYDVTVAAAGSGTVQFNAQLQPDVVGGPLVANAPVLIGPNATPSPTERFTFDANAGSNVSLQLSGVATSPSGQPMTVSVYRPDVGTITPVDAYQQMSTNGADTLQLSNLPTSGMYTVIVSTNGAVGSAAQLVWNTY